MREPLEALGVGHTKTRDVLARPYQTNEAIEHS